MKKVLIAISLLSCLFLFADEKTNNTKQESSKCLDQKNLKVQADSVYQSGCCSWHGGVSGCSGGRVVCNDGSFSPSCTCLGGMPVDKTVEN